MDCAVGDSVVGKNISTNLDIELPADDWLHHAEGLSDQAAAHAAIQW